MTAIPAGTIVTDCQTGRHQKAQHAVEWQPVARNVYRRSTGALVTTSKQPSFAKLEEQIDRNRSTTPCGCRVEADGTCPHGVPSWVLIVGCI